MTHGLRVQHFLAVDFHLHSLCRSWGTRVSPDPELRWSVPGARLSSPYFTSYYEHKKKALNPFVTGYL